MASKKGNTQKSKIDLYVINKVKEMRIAVNLSQANLAYELGVGAGFIGKVKSMAYSTHYNLKILNNIAKILECCPQDFFPKQPL